MDCRADSQRERALPDLLRGPGTDRRFDAGNLAPVIAQHLQPSGVLLEKVFPEFWDRLDQEANLASLL
jgi:hypothetical protein